MHRSVCVVAFSLAFPLLVFAGQESGADRPAAPPPISAQTELSEEEIAQYRAAAGRLLLNDGVAGLKDILEEAGVAPLTFDQETQVQSVWEAHDRERRRVIEADVEVAGSSLADKIRDLEEQLLLAAVKFLNPAQRYALTRDIAGEANSDLPEDEDELREYLGDLRSPAGRGGRVVIDGFGGGRMPNRDEIQEIRINENSFTAEQSRQGRVQTEIVTRGGTGRFNGDVRFNFADESLDARNAFAKSRPPYQQRRLNANLSGPAIRDRLTLMLSFYHDTNEDGDTLHAITPNGLVNDAITRPRKNRGLTTRATAQLNDNHVINTSVSFGTFDMTNMGVGGVGLPEQASTMDGRHFNFQIKETAILSRSLNNEVRFFAGTHSNEFLPVNSGPLINVLGAFRAGGSTNRGENRNLDYGFGDLLMYTGRDLSVRLGFDGGYSREDSVSRRNFNGSFVFSSLDDFLAGKPIQYSVNEGDPNLTISQFEAAAFVQSDFRITPRLALGFGLRYETQTNLGDRNNIDPRLGFAYSIGSSTVIRGGSGIFHQRLRRRTVGQLIQFDGTRQRSLTIRNPAYPDPFLDEKGEATVNVPSSIRIRAADLAAPYTWNTELSIETSFSEGLVLTGAYRFVRGVHLFRGRNLNSPLDVTSTITRSCQPDQDEATCLPPDPSRGRIVQLESTGTSRNQSLRLGFRQRFSFVNINGNYTLESNYTDATGPFGLPADNHDLGAEWAPVSPRHRFNTSVNFRMPWNVNANTRFNWNTGRPYSLRTGRDDNQDTSTNDRPPGVTRNSLTGPGFFEVSMNLSKSVQLRESRSGSSGPAASGGYYGGRRGIRMTITANVQNLLNQVNFQSFSGVQTSPFFGQATRARRARHVQLSVRFNF